MENKHTYQLIFEFLHKLKIQIDLLTIQNRYNSHPLPHSIRSISDTLDKLNIQNMVCQVPNEYIESIPIPSIVFLPYSTELFYIFKGIDSIHNKIRLESFSNRNIIISYDKFIQSWDGILLIAEKSENTFKQPRYRYFINQLIYYLSHINSWWFIILSLYIIGFKIFKLDFNIYDNYIIVLYAINLLGTGSSLATFPQFKKRSSLIQHTCTFNNEDNCYEIFQSPGAYILGWISLSELAFAYFTTNLIWGVFITSDPTNIYFICSSSALLFLIYSLIYQLSTKRICPLCLFIDLVLAVEFTILLFHNGWHFETFPFIDLLNYSVLLVTILSCTKTTHSLITKQDSLIELQEQKERLLSSPKTFWSLLKMEPTIKNYSDNLVTINNMVKTYKHKITFIINPLCPKCGYIFEIIPKLKEYRIDIIFNTSDYGVHNIALKLIALSKKSDWDTLNSSFKKWYNKKYIPNNIEQSETAMAILKEHNQYCKDIHIKSTPTILIDNKTLPIIYNIKDLEFLL